MIDFLRYPIIFMNEAGEGGGGTPAPKAAPVADPKEVDPKEALKVLKKSLEDNYQLRKKILEQEKEFIQKRTEALKLEKDHLRIAELNVEIRENEIDLARKTEKEALKNAAALSEQATRVGKLTEAEKKLLEELKTKEDVQKRLAEKNLKGEEAYKELAQIALEQAQQTYENAVNTRIEKEKELEISKALQKVYEDGDKAIEKVEDSLGGYSKMLKTTSTFMKAFSAENADFGKILSSAFAQLGATIASSMIRAIKQGITGFDDARAKMAALTAGSSRLNDDLVLSATSFVNADLNASNFGLSLSEAREGVMELAEGMADFEQMSQRTRLELSQVGKRLKTMLGVDMTETFNVATKAFQMTGKETKNLAIELYATGAALGAFSQKKIMSEFAPAMQTLAAFTKDKAIKVFKELAAQAAATGLKISELISQVSKYDTFDGAAEAAGRLNSMLGGDYLNSLELLRASESQRVDMLRQSIQMSGKSFNEMSRFEKKAVAAALGISDISKAAQLLQTPEERMAEMAKKAAAAGMSVDEFKERQKAATTFQKKLTQAMESFQVALAPVVTVLNYFAGALAVIANNPVVKVLGMMIALYYAAKITIAAAGAATAAYNAVKSIEILSTITNTFEKGKEAAAKFFSAEATGVETAATAAGEKVKKAATLTNMKFSASIIQMVAALGALLIGIGATAAGLSLLADAFSKMTMGQALGFLGFLAAVALGLVVFIAVAVELAPTYPILLALAAVFLAIGAAAALLGLGIRLAADGIVKIINALATVAKEGVLGTVTMSVLGLATAFMILATAMAIIGPLLPMLGALAFVGAIAFSMIGPSLKDLFTGFSEFAKLDEQKLAVIKTVFEKMPEVKSENAESIRKVTESFGKLALSFKTQKTLTVKMVIEHNNVQKTNENIRAAGEKIGRGLNAIGA